VLLAPVRGKSHLRETVRGAILAPAGRFWSHARPTGVKVLSVAEVAAEAFVLRPRADQPQGRFNVFTALLVTGAAVSLYVIALTVGAVPDRSASSSFLTASPVLCLIGLWIYASVSREKALPQLVWVSAGLLVCFTALTLQYISFPSVVPGGGPLGTNAQSSAALYYFTFHC